MAGRLIIVLLLSFFMFKDAEAKVLPQAKAASRTGSPNKQSISIFPGLRADRRALNLSFANLQNASSVSYLLTYQTSSQDEGAMGSLNLNGPNSVELLFGTCSKGICRYHTGVHNVKLEVNYTTKSGKKYIKRYKIRV